MAQLRTQLLQSKEELDHLREEKRQLATKMLQEVRAALGLNEYWGIVALHHFMHSP